MAKKRANGEGNIRKRKDGRWEGRYTAGIDPETGKPIAKSVLARTQRECKEKLQKAMEELEKIDVTKRRDYTVGEWAQLWYENYAKPSVRASTAAYYKNYIDQHTTMLDDNAQIIDDVVVMRMEEQRYWVSTLFRADMFVWFEAHKGEWDVHWEDVTKKWEMYAVQGPKALEMVNALVETPVDGQKFFQILPNRIDGIDVLINRAGFTGEKLGFEIYYPKDKAPEQEKKLRELAPEFGGREVTEFQVMAWTLPCEAGFYYMRDLRHTNPYEVGLTAGFDWDKDFIGKEALAAIRDNGAEREVVGFTVAEKDIHIKGRNMGNEGEKVFLDGEEIGRVMKITYSYVLDTNNGTIICKKGLLHPGDKILLHGHEAVICAPKFI